MLFFIGTCHSSEILTMELKWSTGINDIYSSSLYYSYNKEMTNKIKHEDCTQPTEISTGTGFYSMKCTKIAISRFPAYIQIVANSSTIPEEIYSNIQVISTSPMSPSIINIHLN